MRQEPSSVHALGTWPSTPQGKSVAVVSTLLQPLRAKAALLVETKCVGFLQRLAPLTGKLLLIQMTVPVTPGHTHSELVRPWTLLLTWKRSLGRVIPTIKLLTDPKVLTLTWHLSDILPLVEAVATTAPFHPIAVIARICLVLRAAVVGVVQVSVTEKALLSVQASLVRVLQSRWEVLLVHTRVHTLVPVTWQTELVVPTLLPWHWMTLHLTRHLVVLLTHEVLAPWELALAHVTAHLEAALLWESLVAHSLVAHPLVAKETLVTLKTLAHSCKKKRKTVALLCVRVRERKKERERMCACVCVCVCVRESPV